MKKEKIILAYSGGLDTSVILKWLVAFALSSIAFTLSKFAMDITLFMSRNFGFIRFPDEFTTGSSIMPHKKNPDVFELVRAKCNKIQALPNEIKQKMGRLIQETNFQKAQNAVQTLLE